MGFNFPNAPSSGDTYTPASGPTFVWDGVTWKAQTVGVPATVFMSDTSPPSPAPGQLWWDSDSGRMMIWYADPDSAQWVQVGGNAGVEEAPADGKEYVRVNGVWRLVRESVSLSGTQGDITVPAWGPSQARISVFAYLSGTGSVIMRVSVDGTTFPSTSGDYFVAGFFRQTGAGLASVNNIPNNASSNLPLTGTGDNSLLPWNGDSTLGLTRTGGTYFPFRVQSGAYNNAPATLWQTIDYVGYVQGPSFPGTGNIVKLRWYGTVSINSGKLTIDWLQ